MRLLLVEDEKSLSKAIVAILKHNNYSVDAVYDGEMALEYLDADVYDGVIMDIMMPKIDGLTVLKNIRAKGNNVPVIMLTAKTETDDKIIGLNLGADDYLSKPFSTQELLARIRAITRRKTEQKTPALELAGVKLDVLTFELSYQGKSIKLNNKIFQLVEIFMHHPGQIFSVEDLIDKVWNYENDAEINVVWVYISTVRKIFKDMGMPLTIKSTRNVGYSLEVNRD